VLQCVAVCEALTGNTAAAIDSRKHVCVLQSAVCCSVLQCVAVCEALAGATLLLQSPLANMYVCCSMLCVAVCCSVLQCFSGAKCVTE